MGNGEKPVIQVRNLYKIYRVGESYVKALKDVYKRQPLESMR